MSTDNFSVPTIKEGRVAWEDSPLVAAARDGHVLVIGTPAFVPFLS